MSDTLSGHLLTSHNTSVTTPPNPVVSAYFADITIGAGAYGSDTAQHFADLCNQVFALNAAMRDIKKLISAS